MTDLKLRDWGPGSATFPQATEDDLAITRSKSVCFAGHLNVDETKKRFPRTQTPYWARSPAGSRDSRDEPDFPEFLEERSRICSANFLVPGALKDIKKKIFFLL